MAYDTSHPRTVNKSDAGRRSRHWPIRPVAHRADRDPASHSRRRSEVLEEFFTGHFVRVACRGLGQYLTLARVRFGAA